jgi:hypothetical protein
MLRGVVDAVSAVDVQPLAGLLDSPHAYAGHEYRSQLMLEEAVPRLPACWRDGGRGRVEAALALEPVEAHLVHGDLAGHDMRWSGGIKPRTSSSRVGRKTAVIVASGPALR